LIKLENNLEDFYKLCKENGLKITPQRIEVYKVLVASTEHPSADVVYDKVKKVLPNVSLDTVNRTLNTLSDIGAAFVVEGSGDVKRFDGNLDNHQHFKCIKCRKIFDFQHIPFDNVEVPGELKEKFKILRTTVYVEGLCRTCLQE
jgi:Fur family transcriptional regulator, peroxide stress response regulator